MNKKYDIKIVSREICLVLAKHSVPLVLLEQVIESVRTNFSEHAIIPNNEGRGRVGFADTVDGTMRGYRPILSDKLPRPPQGGPTPMKYKDFTSLE